jgi:hypothetical protein
MSVQASEAVAGRSHDAAAPTAAVATGAGFPPAASSTGFAWRRLFRGALVAAAAGALAFVGLMAVNPNAFNGRFAKYRLPLVGAFAHQAPGAWRSQEPGVKVVRPHFVKGGLNIAMADRVEGLAYNGVQSTLRWDFTGKAMSVNADYTAFPMPVGAETKFRISRDHHKGFASIQTGEGVLTFRHQYGDHYWEQAIPYDPVADRWLRIRHVPADDTLRWELSPDGVAWTEYARDKVRFDITKVKTEIYAGTNRPAPTPGAVRYSDFRIGEDDAPPAAISKAAVVTYRNP